VQTPIANVAGMYSTTKDKTTNVLIISCIEDDRLNNGFSYDWKKSLNVLIQNKVNRVLTSGLARNVELGLPVLKEMKKYSAENIQIMIGGGVSAANAARLVNEINPDALHFSGTVKMQLDEESLFSETILKVDEARVNRILATLNTF
jgi:copper homeostasis protein CutC